MQIVRSKHDSSFTRIHSAKMLIVEPSRIICGEEKAHGVTAFAATPCAWGEKGSDGASP